MERAAALCRLTSPPHAARWAGHCARAAPLVALTAGVIVAFGIGAALLAAPVPTPAVGIGKADVLVVLGGETLKRSAYAAKLWRAGVAPAIVVTGTSTECADIAELIASGGVPADRITRECHSTSTFDNAAFTRPILEALHVRKALIITSWFHTRRALATFEAACPGVAFTVAAADTPVSFWDAIAGPGGPTVLQEYAKAPFYALRRLAIAMTGVDHNAGLIGGPCTPENMIK